jgi:hypothetical protein
MADIERSRVGLTVDNVQTGEPMDVNAEIAKASIVLRIGDTVHAVSHKSLSLDEALVMADQLTRVAQCPPHKAGLKVTVTDRRHPGTGCQRDNCTLQAGHGGDCE